MRLELQLLKSFLVCLLVSLVACTLPPSGSGAVDSERNAPGAALSSPMAFSLTILSPGIGRPAISLNGSELELRVAGPSGITSWTFMLWREYRNYTLTYDPPVHASGEWSVNVTVPSQTAADLYDLRVAASDGLTEATTEEWNAVQVRYAYPSSFRVFHLTDTHIFSTPSGSSRILLSTLYQAALANADAIIMTGDLTDEGSAASFTYFRELLRQSRVPIFMVPGNHDQDSAGGTYITYRSIFGADYFALSFGSDVLIVGANSHSNRILNTTQIGWIERDVAASNARVKILAFHHPLYNVVDPPVYYLDAGEAAELRRIVDTYGVDVVLTGHLHNDRVDRLNNALWILTTANGGSVWRMPTDPGHHRNGFRMLTFENYLLTGWNWTVSQPWSQPWDEVELQRSPSYLHEVDKGAYLWISNHLNYSLPSQIVDFIVEPLASPLVYRASGGSVTATVNATTAWLARLLVDVAPDSSTVLRIYASNPQAPVLGDIQYPLTATTGSVVVVSASASNPASGVQAVQLNWSFGGGSYGLTEMERLDATHYRFYTVFDFAGVVRFQIVAWDYSGLRTATQFYSFEVTSTATSPPELPWPLIVTGAVIAVAVVVVVVYLFRRRSSASKRTR